MRRQPVYKLEALLARARAMLRLKCSPEGIYAKLDRLEYLGHLGRFLLALSLRAEVFVQGLLLRLGGFAFHALGFVQKGIGFLMLIVRTDTSCCTCFLLVVGLQRLMCLFLIPEMQRSKQLTNANIESMCGNDPMIEGGKAVKHFPLLKPEQKKNSDKNKFVSLLPANHKKKRY